MVSIIIPCHNNLATIEKAIYSALNQTYKDIEVIIVDNGSDKIINENIDSSEALYDSQVYIKNKIINQLSEENRKRIRVLSFPEMLGPAKARNIGINCAKGDYVAFLDADDYWAEDKLEKQIKVMERYKIHGEGPKIVFSGRCLIDSKGNITGRYIGCEKIVNYRRLLRSNQINCSSVLISKKLMIVNPFPEGDFHEDYAVWLKVLRKGGYAAGINQPLLFYRLGKNTMSSNKIKSAIMTYKVYRYLGIDVIHSIEHMVTYVIIGAKKHYFNTKNQKQY